VTSRRYNTLSRCSNDTINQAMKHHHHHQQQQQQKFVQNDKPTTEFSARIPQHTMNGDVRVTAAERQYFVLEPEQQ